MRDVLGTIALRFTAILVLVMLALFGMGYRTHAVWAQDGHVHSHMQYHEVYKTWCQPGHPNCSKALSCCDGRVTGKDELGNETVEGHCYPTEFRPRITEGSSWEARLAPEDVKVFGVEWLSVPDGRLVREINPDPTGQAGHICTHQAGKNVLCARPPTGAL